MVNRATMLALAGGLAAGAGLCQARAAELTEADFLAEMPTVLSASRLAQPLMDAPGAITVIDRKLIEASGYHSLPDLFRLVPGMYVGQEKGWFQNVSRTLVESYSRRMQVLVDGRSIYLPSIGGVRWDAIPLAVDDVERIEVVRGPNAASFGANAFTGVINIITRHPDDVRGRLLHLIGGDHGHREAWFRWAGGGDGAGSHRVTLGRREDGGLVHLRDDERSNVFSYRGDISLSGGAGLNVQLGYLHGGRGLGEAGNYADLPRDQDVDSYSAQGIYRRPLPAGHELTAKLSLDTVQTREIVPFHYPPLVPAGTYYPLDLLSRRWHAEFQVDSEHGERLRTAAGGFMRRDEVRSAHYYGRDDKLRADSWGAFFHGEWRVAPAWLANFGAFFEDHELTDGRWSPRATLHWQPGPNHGIRLGVSRAYRNPVMFETSADWRLRLFEPDGSPLVLPSPYNAYAAYIRSTNSMEPESMLSQEIGYLGQWPELGLGLDLRVFKERIDGYISAECTSPNRRDCQGALPRVPRDFFNIGGAHQLGMEAQARWQPARETALIANYAVLDVDSHFDEPRYSPPQQYGLHLMHQFPGRIDLTLSHYWVPEFKPMGMGSAARSPAYKRLDARLAKRFKVDGMAGQLALAWHSLGGGYTEFSDNVADNGQPENLFDPRAYLHFQLDF